MPIVPSKYLRSLGFKRVPRFVSNGRLLAFIYKRLKETDPLFAIPDLGMSTPEEPYSFLVSFSELDRTGQVAIAYEVFTYILDLRESNK